MSAGYARVPSRFRLSAAFGQGPADKVRAVLTGTIEPEAASEKCAAWVRACSNPPRWSERAEVACDEIIGGHGVEVIRSGRHWSSYHGDIVAAYVNQGDTYATTLLFDYQAGTVRLTTWGDWVESYEKRHARLP